MERSPTEIAVVPSVVLVVRGRLEKRRGVCDFDEVAFTTSEDGARNLIEARFAGSNKAIVFDQ